MAGVKGRSGGPRANSGGVRPGAGRKPAPKVMLDIPVPVADSLAHKDPMVFLMALMNDLEADIKVRADAAKALLPFMHGKKGEGGKKDEKAERAKKAATGKFAAAAAPKLIVNNR